MCTPVFKNGPLQSHYSLRVQILNACVSTDSRNFSVSSVSFSEGKFLLHSIIFCSAIPDDGKLLTSYKMMSSFYKRVQVSGLNLNRSVHQSMTATENKKQH